MYIYMLYVYVMSEHVGNADVCVTVTLSSHFCHVVIICAYVREDVDCQLCI
jgi:hypothetical protein